METRLKPLLIITILILQISTIKSASPDADWASKCNRCKCVWSDGKKTANCTNIQLSSIPTDMSSDIRDVDFSFNPLYELQGYVFSNANLSDVHKLKLQNCNIEQVHNKAFQNLLLLIELDLSNNNIQKLDKDVFNSTPKLRLLSLWNNKLATLESELFSTLVYLHKIFLDKNELTTISSDLFSLGCPVIHIGLANNRLITIDVEFFRNIPRLVSLDLSGNLWNCDCNLQKFREQALDLNLVTITPECHDPPRLRSKKWSDMSNIFACQPKILDPTGVNTEVRVDGYSNYSLFCRIEGEPRPNVTWLHNNRPVDLKRNPHKYAITSSEFTPFWHNLTIFSANYRDKGDYKCTATNDAGSQTKTIILDIYEYSGGIIAVSSQSPQFTWLVVLVCLLILLFLGVILLLCYWCLRKRRHQQQKIKAKNNMSRSSEMMSFDGRSADDKALITNVNPVNKPPRQHWVPSSVTSEGTDVSEAKKMLIDDESCIGDDESHSIFDYTSDLTLGQHRQHCPPINHHPYSDHLDTSNLHYPPDLLAVPTMHSSNHRAVAQVSPAASYASSNNTQITSILPTTQDMLNQQLPLSPVHYPVPQYTDTISLMRYGTLPYSRSHSPFAAAGGLVGVPVRVPRHGYVTIPRKPRTSWSSEPAGGLPEISEPLYDNLGLRTTATGSSVLSLNKEPSTPRSGRSSNGGLLSTTTSTVPSMIEPIVEHDSSMSPPTSNIHGVQQHSTLPRRYGATSTPKSARLSEVSSDISPIRNPIQSVDSTPISPSFETRPHKIPPLPPPKPKKNVITKPTTAVFEDETEDGTEV